MQLVACDLDGTIVRPDGSISARTLAALQACEQDGVAVVFVTGRPPRWMLPIARATGHRGLAVCGNGAVIYDLGDARVVQARTLSVSTVLRIAEILRPQLPGAVFGVETTTGFRGEPAFRRHADDQSELVRRGPLFDLMSDDPAVLKLLCRVEGAGADGMLVLARESLAGIAEPVHSGNAWSTLEISALGVSKASTLALLAAQRQIEQTDVVAFGDMPNDIPMLRWAGRSYAMADGHPDAIAAADAVAPACSADGVAQVLERLLADRRSNGPTIRTDG